MDIIKNQNAQFMLLAGFIIAIGLAISTVMLNNIIFESNMASESGTEPAKYDIVNMIQITSDEMRSAYRSAPGIPDVQGIINFTNQMKNFKGNLSKLYAFKGSGINLSLNATNWEQWNYANFTDNGTSNGLARWTLIQNVSNSNITVNNITSGSFVINITNMTNASNYWSINITGAITINNTQISANVTQPYSIVFENGAGAYGRYNITGTASGRQFTRARDYVLSATLTYSTSKIRTNITIPVTVPW